MEKLPAQLIISIHALLAESDGALFGGVALYSLFLSTLSLRRATLLVLQSIIVFLPISIHALLAESDLPIGYVTSHWFQFLSTLSLRRATLSPAVYCMDKSHFYPRSPCGERLQPYQQIHPKHNFYPRSPCGERLLGAKCGPCMGRISIHALLAESDWQLVFNRAIRVYFYPRSPCGERQT